MIDCSCYAALSARTLTVRRTAAQGR